ncbi:MAG: SDR family oxidoreductase [Burkholderiaceae bacterium]
MSHPLFDLSGRTALVTGSSRGLGHAIAEGMAQAGARLVLNGVDADRLSTSAQSLRAKGHAVEEAAFDVTDEAAVQAAFARLDDSGVEVDILVNNAGIQLRKPLLEFTLAEWNSIMATNLTSAFLVAREAARRMVARGRGGKVINIGSLLSEAARATVAPYAATKGGIKMLTRSMAAEWAQHGIQANAIGPGYMSTELNKALIDNREFDAWVKGRTPARRWGRPDELAGTAIFLASAASDYVNGQIIYVDGGMLAVL